MQMQLKSSVLHHRRLISSIYTSSNAHLYINASVTFTNTTLTHTMYLTNTNDSSAYANLLYAQIYGYTGSGQSIPTASAPMVLLPTNGGKPIVTPAFQQSSILDNINTAFPGTWLNVIQNIGGLPVQNIYTQSNLVAGINQANNQSQNIFYPQQPTSGWAGLNVTNAGQVVGTLNVSSNPPYYPEVQLIAKLSTLAIYIPVAKPTITNIQPNPVYIQSGAQNSVIATVFNNASISSSVSISGACGNTTFSTPSTIRNLRRNQ